MAEKTKYKLSTWKYAVEAEFETEEEALKELSDKYMFASKCDAPGDHLFELMAGNTCRPIENIAKGVFFYVYEKVYGHMQWIRKYNLSIYPFKKEHWWPCEGFEFKECEFKYKITTDDEK